MRISIKFENPSRLLKNIKKSFDGMSLCSMFDTMVLEVCEPCCPFCGKVLENAHCFCSTYTDALRKLYSQYDNKELRVKAYNNGDPFAPYLEPKNVISLAISRKNIHITKVAKSDLTPSLFDNGTIATINNDNSWFVSSGIFENEILTFFVRKKDEDEVFMYEVTQISNLPPQYSIITLYTSKLVYVPRHLSATRLGGYTKRWNTDIVDTFSYQEFLQKLKATQFQQD